jgi:eukaryotic-like serine/threonine-protein kinase
MPTPSRVRRWVAAALVAAGSATPATAQSAGDGDWPMAGGDARHSGAADGPAPPYRAVWTARLEGEGPLAGPVVSGGAVVVVGRTSVISLDPSTGEVVWEKEREEGLAGAPAIAGDLVLHATGREDTAALMARRLEGGGEEWSVPTEASVGGGVTVDDERAYAATRAGEVLAVDVETGEVAWRFEAAGQVSSTPAFADGHVLVTARNPSTGSTTLQAVDADSGEESWQLSPQGTAIPSSPSAGSGIVVVGLGDGANHAIDLESGGERWSMPTRAGVGPSQMAALPEGTDVGGASGIYAPDAFELSRLDPATGDERWSYQLSREILDSSPVLSGRYALIGDASGLAAAIDATTGLLVWKRTLASGPVRSIAVTSERIFVSTGDGIVVALEHDPDGSLLREESPTVLDPVRAALNFLGAAAAVGVLLTLLFRTFRPRPRPEER